MALFVTAQKRTCYVRSANVGCWDFHIARIAARWVHGGGGWRLHNQRRDHCRGWDKFTAWRKKLRLGDVLEELRPGKKFVTYRVSGKIAGVAIHQKTAIFCMSFCFTSITYLATLDAINFVLGLQSSNFRPALQSA
jgi:hypothetical protein